MVVVPSYCQPGGVLSPVTSLSGATVEADHPCVFRQSCVGHAFTETRHLCGRVYSLPETHLQGRIQGIGTHSLTVGLYVNPCPCRM